MSAAALQLAPCAPRPPAAPRGGLRPFARATAQARRLGRRLAAGLTPAQVARAEGVPEAEITTLLAETDLAELADAYRALAELPEADARERLLVLARQLLEEAIVSGDARIAFFVLREERRGRDPARRLVDGLLAAQRRAERVAAEPAPEPPPAALPAAAPPAARPQAPRPPADPADRMARRAASRLREALVSEHAILRRAAAGPELRRPDAETEPATKAAPLRPTNRHHRRRLAAIRRKRKPSTTPPRANAPPPRSRGP